MATLSPLAPASPKAQGFYRRTLAKTASLALLLSMAVSGPASALIVSSDVDFSVVYLPTALPNESNPAWQLLGSAPTGTATINDGALTLNTPTVGSRYYRINNTSVWNGASSTGSTIEFSLKVDSLSSETTGGSTVTATNSTIIYFSTGGKGYGFFFRPDAITYQAGANAPVHAYNTDVFNRYRITLSDTGEASLYVNDSATPLISGYMGTTLQTASNFIYFGDASNSAGGIVHWEYFAFTNAGAFSPIPEGNTALLGLLGGGLLIGGLHFSKRRRTLSSR